MESVCIFSTDDVAEAETVRSILEENEIQTMMKNMYTQNIFGGLKPFSGHDPIAGSIQVFILENQVDKALRILNDEIEDESPDVREYESNDETKNNEDNLETVDTLPNINRTVYFSYILSALSFLIIPYLINIPFLIRLYKPRRTLFYMLLVQSTIFLIGAIIFMILAY